MVTIPADRLATVPEITLYRGGHKAPTPGAPPSELELCFNEYVAYLAGEPHSASPACQCPVIGAATMRFNDRSADEPRQALVAVTNDDPKTSLAYRCLGTRGDGYQKQRGYLAADFAVRIALPIWLETSGRTEAAQRLRALPELIDAATARSARKIVLEVRKDLPNYWAWRNQIRDSVRGAVLKALKDKPAAATTATAAATDATAGDAPTWEEYYDAVYKAVREKLGERWPVAIAQANTAFLQLLERMVALGEAERACGFDSFERRLQAALATDERRKEAS